MFTIIKKKTPKKESGRDTTKTLAKIELYRRVNTNNGTGKILIL